MNAWLSERAGGDCGNGASVTCWTPAAQRHSPRLLAVMRYFAPIVALSLCVGCASRSHDQITPLQNDARSLEGREDIIEVVFRHMCQPQLAEKDVSHYVNWVHKVYFLALGDAQDPGPELL